MAATTGGDIIRTAFETIGVLGEGQTLDAGKGAVGFRRLNQMLRAWSLQNLTIPVTVREVFDLTANKGGPSNPYTIGDGGDFDTARPPTQNALVGCGVILTTSSPAVEVPRTVYTDQMWEAIQIKDLSTGGGNSIFTGIYYNPTYPLGSIYVWPVPTDGVNDIALYLRKPLRTFPDQTTSIDVPDGSEEAMAYNLAVRLCAPYSVPLDQGVVQMARSSLAILKRSNYHLADIVQDPATTMDRRGYYYNIQSGNM